MVITLLQCVMYTSILLRSNLISSQSVHGATRKTLLKVKGFSEAKVEKIKEAIAKCQVQPRHSALDIETLLTRLAIADYIWLCDCCGVEPSA